MVAICPRDGTVTLALTLGFTFGKPILYLSTEANDPLVATLEGATYAPALKDVPFALEDASPGESAERIYVFANGPTGRDNPQRQGLNSALSDGRGPLNVLGGIPTINLDYSPLWRLFPAKWTAAAIEHGYRSRLTDAIEIADFQKKGFLSGLDDHELRSSCLSRQLIRARRSMGWNHRRGRLKYLASARASDNWLLKGGHMLLRM